MEYLFQVLVLFAAIIAVIGRTWNDEKGGHFRFTRLGYAAVGVALFAFVLSLTVTYKNDREQRGQDRTQKEEIEYLKSLLAASQAIKESGTLQLDISKGLTDQQVELLGKLGVVTEKQVELLEESKVLTQRQIDQLLLLTKLAGSQERQIRQLEKLSLDRDLSGVEISFKPSADHWALIARAFDKIPPPSPGAPYSASTMMAERVGKYWDIDFREITTARGTVLPEPLSTNVPENQLFEKVIDTALVELLIRWCEDTNLESTVSMRGNYPTAVTVSKDKIAFIFRPPTLRLGLGFLYAKPTVTFRGHGKPPATITVRSLDFRVKFDEQLELEWKEKRGELHYEKWMPYISGPHTLKIDWSNVLLEERIHNRWRRR